MNLERFQNSPSGRLIKFGQGEAAYWAFVPNPLPPALQLDAELVRILSDADRALGELSGLGRMMPNPQLLIGPFIRREAVLSSRIEGTEASLTDLYAYEAAQLSFPGVKPSPSEADVREVYNYVRAMEYGLERIKTFPVSLRLLGELHERLMEGVRGERATPGEFRRSQNWIGRPGCTLLEQAQDANTRAKRLQNLQFEWRQKLTRTRAPALLLRLADSLFESPMITINQARQILSVSYPSAQKNVEKLVKAGILRPMSESSYGKTFAAQAILEVVGDLQE